MAPLAPIFVKAYWSLAGLGALYAAFLLLLTHPTVQRHALYAHKIHSGFWHDVDNPESFGFAHNQVTPFNLTTPDHETLYCWHVMPLALYAQHEAEITSRPGGPVADLRSSFGYELLKSDPRSRVVLNFHGNAGHVAQGWRTDTYRSLTSNPHTHVLTCDYRGFGRSTGIPSEAGLTTDAITLTHYTLHHLQQPPQRTILLGQSLGTAVASTTTLYFLSPTSPLLPANLTHPSPPLGPDTSFAATILVAPFPSLPALCRSYRILGALPVLQPTAAYPRLRAWLEARIRDRWPVAARLAEAVRLSRGGAASSSPFRLAILHARNDPDIPFREGEAVYQAVEEAFVEVAEAEAEADAEADAEAELAAEAGAEPEGKVKKNDKLTITHERLSWRGSGDPERPVARRGLFAYRAVAEKDGGRSRAELEIVRYGGHNRVVSYAQVALAVERAFVEAEAWAEDV